MSPVFAICDMETEYAVRFMEYLNQRKLPFELQFFTDPAKLCEYGKQKRIELLLISERAVSEAVRSLDVGKMILLAEGKEAAFEEIPAVYKYQPGRQIVREVLDCYSAEKEVLPPAAVHWLRGSRICGVYSLADPTQQMLFSLTCGQILAETRSVLYLNLMKHAGMEQMAGESADGDLSDLLFLYRSGQRGFSCRLAAMARKLGKLDYIPGPFCPEDLGELNGQEWIGFLQETASVCGHDVLLLDLSDAVRGLPGILKLCTDRFVLSGEDPFSLQRRPLLEREWEMEEGGICWLTPPVFEDVREGKWFLETLPGTAAGSYVRRHICLD